MPAGPPSEGMPQPPGPVIRPFRPHDRDWVAARHHAHYRTVEGFDDGFDRAVAAALCDLLARKAPDRSRGFVLDPAGRPQGCLFLFEDAPDQARIRLFLLDAEIRGQGLGHAMLAHAVAQAQSAGFAALAVSTFDRHAAACALYRSAGFHETRQTPVRAFGHDLRQIDFHLDLSHPGATR